MKLYSPSVLSSCPLLKQVRKNELGSCWSRRKESIKNMHYIILITHSQLIIVSLTSARDRYYILIVKINEIRYIKLWFPCFLACISISYTDNLRSISQSLICVSYIIVSFRLMIQLFIPNCLVLKFESEVKII